MNPEFWVVRKRRRGLLRGLSDVPNVKGLIIELLTLEKTSKVTNSNCQSTVAGEPGPPDGQADISTSDVTEAASVPLWEEPSPFTSTITCFWRSITGCTFLQWNQGYPNQWGCIIVLGWWADYGCRGSIFYRAVSKVIPCVDWTHYLLKMKQPLNAGQASSTTALGPSADDLVAIRREWNLQHKWNQLSKFVMSGKKVWAFLSSSCSIFQLYSFISGK